MTRPALLGGRARFPAGLPFARPALPPLERVAARLADGWANGQVTNGRLVRQLEAEVAERLDAAHVVAVSSCTTGLMLVTQALAPAGDVLLPSFTFSASAHAVAWTGARPRFTECSPTSFQVDPDDLAGRLDGAGAILATHVFGAPCPIESLAAHAQARGIPLVVDAAHAFGATRAGRPAGGLALAEVFSLTPTKPLVAGEGGLVCTTDAGLAEAVRLGRDYGNPGDYDTRFVGLNGRMSELHAATGLESLADFDKTLAGRRAVAARYARGLDRLPGVHLQTVDCDDTSTWKDVTVRVDAAAFGLDRDAVATGLAAEGIDTRKYFWPPVHRQQAYAHLPSVHLPVTDAVSAAVLSLPVAPHLSLTIVDGVCEVLRGLHGHAEEIKARAA